MSSLDNLLRLEVRGNQLTDLRSLANLSKLEHLDVGDNAIVSLENSSLVSLRNLSFYDNRVEMIEPLSTLTLLENLYAPNNRIRDLSPLVGLSELSDVRLESNRISRFVGILIPTQGSGRSILIIILSSALKLTNTIRILRRLICNSTRVVQVISTRTALSTVKISFQTIFRPLRIMTETESRMSGMKATQKSIRRRVLSSIATTIMMALKTQPTFFLMTHLRVPIVTETAWEIMLTLIPTIPQKSFFY